jgi:hypothetical protein
MTGRRAIAVLTAAAALLCFAPPAAATQQVSAPALLASAARLDGELALLGQGSSPLASLKHRSLSELKFKNRDGYTISIVASGQTVALGVTRDHGSDRGHTSVTSYLAHGKVTPTSINASFGGRGRVSLRFHPSGEALRASQRLGCKAPSKGVIGRLGLFVGELRFRGEEGYTSAEVHRVRGGSINFAALLACLAGVTPGQRGVHPALMLPLGSHPLGIAANARPMPSGVPGVRTHPNRGPKPTTLVADSKLPVSRTFFAAQVRGSARARFLAAEEDSEGSIGIVRFVLASASPSAFAFDDSLASASVAPPAPFSGTGAFQHGPGSTKSWDGSLAVSFLGAPHVSLTGAPFNVQLTRGW